MSATQLPQIDPESQYTGILDRTMRAYATAKMAAAGVADCLAGRADACSRDVQQAEEELDRLDREIDSSITTAILEATPAQAQELVSAMKMVIDLERIGDLLASVASCARALANRILLEDLSDLVRMATVIEKMLGDAHGAFIVRNVDRALAVLRADADLDRFRNLLLLRNLEHAQSHGTQDSIHVIFMAQALERAGDHVKNLAEEVCHLTTGHTIRHLVQRAMKPDEQIYLNFLKSAHGLSDSAGPVAVRSAESAVRSAESADLVRRRRVVHEDRHGTAQADSLGRP